MNFCDFVGHDDGKLALILNAIDPRCGGVLFAGERGSGKSTLARLFRDLLPDGLPFVEVPLNVTEESLLGAIDMEETIRRGKKILQPGILGRSDSGVIYVDNINLLPPSVVSLIFETQDRGIHIVEREGFAVSRRVRFITVATMDPEGGAFSHHFLDRFGMSVLWRATPTREERMEIAQKAASFPAGKHAGDRGQLEKLGLRIVKSRQLLDKVSVSPVIESYIVNRCIAMESEGHRGELFLLYGARAYAAFCSAEAVTEEHVEHVLPLVLGHRARLGEEMEEDRARNKQEGDREAPHEQREHGGHEESHGDEPSDENLNHGEETSPGGENQAPREMREREPSRREQVFETGATFEVRRIILGKDRIKRAVSGRRTKTVSQGKSGRYVRSRYGRNNRDIAIDATLRAAAPFQRMRGRNEGEAIIIRPEDLRFKERERKMGHLVLFLVDGSGSMGARRRMTETKGAIQSLLLDCYQKRDKVSMIVFRRDRAEVVLPPTSSFERAAKRLREIPVGGKTPLSAGLIEAYKLVKQMKMQRPNTRCLVVLVTDGKANQGLTGSPINEELAKISVLLAGITTTDYIVVDTEDKQNLMKMDLAPQLACQLRAAYYLLPDLRSEYLTGMVQKAKNPVSHHLHAIDAPFRL